MRENRRERRIRTSPETTEGILTLEVLDDICGDGEDGRWEVGDHGIEEERQDESSSSTDMNECEKGGEEGPGGDVQRTRGDEPCSKATGEASKAAWRVQPACGAG